MGKTAVSSEKATVQRFVQEKNSLALTVLSSNDSNLISLVKFLLDDFQKKSKKRISVKQYNAEIAQAEKRIKSGKFTSHDQVMAEMETW